MKTVIIIVVILLLVGGGYIAYKKYATSSQAPQAMMSTGTGQQSPHPSGGMGGRHFGNMPQGSVPIFGTVTQVNGNTISLQRQSRNGNSTTETIDLTGSVQYTGGSQSNIQTGTRIGGYGTKNSDGSINAEQVMINPTFGNRGQNSQQNSGQ